MRRAVFVVGFVAVLGACGGGGKAGGDAVGSADASSQIDAGTADASNLCAPGAAGIACVFAKLAAAQSCDADAVASFVAELEPRRGDFPLWQDGQAMFVAQAADSVAGAWNGWIVSSELPALCSSGWYAATTAIDTGRWPYKLVDGDGTYVLDPMSAAFAYDDFEGNTDHRNSVLDTPDSGLGHLIEFPAPLCSDALGNCRAVHAYLPAGYDDPANAARAYPVIFMHDGQNVFDDNTCCFGHGGWQINVELDNGTAGGAYEPTIVVAADNTTNRNNEYGWTIAGGGVMETFMDFQIDSIQPAAAARLRLDATRTFIAGSSLGGLVAMYLALDHPDVYAGGAALSGAFWPEQDTSNALRDNLPGIGKVGVGLYVDNGGAPDDDNSDGYDDTVEVENLMLEQGWTEQTSDACTLGSDALCYHWEPNATHDELAWRARAWRFLEFFVGT